MKRTSIAIGVLLLASCATPQTSTAPAYTLTNAENDCAAQGVPFELLSGCLQSHMQDYAPEWRIGAEADLLDVYFAWLSAAGNRVSQGELFESEGRTQAAQLRARLRNIAVQRNSLARQQALNNAMVGLAIMNAATPRPGPTIQCRSTTTLGVTQTTCN